eukprot:m.116474 g.116474  ORF g.116474 m.116474 type:complete len:339 (+) comp28507_c1_seq1:382-1398(+)
MPQRQLTALEQMLSSAGGAFLTSFVVTPFDVVKTRLQTQAMQANSTSVTALCDECAVVILRNGLMEHTCLDVKLQSCARFNGTTDAFVKITQREGASALWRGLPPTLVMAVPLTVMYFTAYDRLSDKLGRHKTSTPILAGSIARFFSVTTISPIEMLRTKMQASGTAGYSEIIPVITNAVRTQGYSSLWRGLGATLARDIPFSVVYWFGYENLKRRYQVANGINVLRSEEQNNRSIPPMASFAAGAASGAVAATLTLPFDVIKTHQQTQLGLALVGARDSAQTGAAVFRDIVRNRGYGGLFVGLIPRVLKVAPACAIMISTYEFAKEYFREKPLLDRI